MSFSKSTIIKNKFLQILFLLVFASFFSACAHQQEAKPSPSEDKDKQKVPPSQHEVSWKLPIEIPEGEFYKVGGWYSDHHLLYITNLEQSSSVYLYNLLTGNSKLIYKSEVPIVTLQTSPSKKNILIQTSPSTYEGQVIILSPEGSEIFTHSIPSYELAFEWNPYNESQILISAFNENWTFQMLLLDIEQRKTTELTLPQPFIKWIGNENVAYLNWNGDSPSLFAPLMTKNLSVGTEEEIFTDVLQFATYKGILMTVAVKDEDQLQAAYTFYDQDKKLINSFSMPHLSIFSGWLVPYHDLNVRKAEFFTLMPLKSAEADAYRDGFELVRYDIEKGSTTVIMHDLKNEPILLSPSGDAALYGNRFEEIIDLNTKELKRLTAK